MIISCTFGRYFSTVRTHFKLLSWSSQSNFRTSKFILIRGTIWNWIWCLLQGFFLKIKYAWTSRVRYITH